MQQHHPVSSTCSGVICCSRRHPQRTPSGVSLSLSLSIRQSQRSPPPQELERRRKGAGNQWPSPCRAVRLMCRGEVPHRHGPIGGAGGTTSIPTPPQSSRRRRSERMPGPAASMRVEHRELSPTRRTVTVSHRLPVPDAAGHHPITMRPLAVSQVPAWTCRCFANHAVRAPRILMQTMATPV